MRNTIRNVTTVVPVLITSCHVSLYPKNGPVTAQATTTDSARRKVYGRPEMRALVLANPVNQLRDFVGLILPAPYNPQTAASTLREGITDEDYAEIFGGPRRRRAVRRP